MKLDHSLVIMAAGMGSRYGGLKQLERFCGHTLLEYSIHDALKAGFNHVVCVIKPEMQPLFESTIAHKLPKGLKLDYAFQTVPAHRSKPYGTGEAVLCARSYVGEAFAVINADDYYGPGAFKALIEFFQNNTQDLCLVAYALQNTLSTQGGVSRAICKVDRAGKLSSLEEKTDLRPSESGLIVDANGDIFDKDTPVSLNCWGLRSSFLDSLEAGFRAFKAAPEAHTAEYYLPAAVSQWLKLPGSKVELLSTKEQWCGVTFREDTLTTEAYILSQYTKHRYTEPLF